MGGSLIYSEGSSSDLLEMSPIEITNGINNAQLKAIEEIIKLSQNNDINVIFIETPKSLIIEQYPEYQDIMNQYSALLEKNNCPYIVSETTYEQLDNKSNSKYYSFDSADTKYFHDQIHLSSEGSAEFSKELLEIISQ